MYPIETSYPMELVHMDFLTIGKPNTDKMINILIVTDHFTKYSQAYVTPNQTAPVVARTLGEFSGPLWMASKNLNRPG